ncbi:hypothetical protein GCM10022254_24280 [Actinomadura meridiana]|uniref:Penicillin-binding protein transpeptidase domain-containing protein n=1 Tax=Actinomadura meridiana TaxID=559626 RepID=A0ABP8BY37_9ACTN
MVTAQRTIRNDEDHALGRTTLKEAFAASCNTTFARLAVERLGPTKLAASARRFGFGTRITPGVDAADGSFPDPKNGAELAEAAIGQGRVQASPLLMASVAAAAGAGLPDGTAGKTGTAELGDGQTHAWFIGYRGDVAFSVFVEAGGSGPRVAAPLAARFLTALG